MDKPKVGDSVQIQSKHWARPNEFGLIVDRNGTRWLVQFEIQAIGIEGNKLWLDENTFTVLRLKKRA